MHRLLVPAEELEKDVPALPKEARDHLKVLRPKPGEEIELFDGKGRWRIFQVDGGGRETRVVGRGGAGDGRRGAGVCLAPRPPDLVLFACVTKGSRWDWTVEKATELGVTRIVPVVSARTIVRIDADDREAKRARWTRIAEDAARQSDAKWLPEVLAPVAFAESLALVRETRCFVGALTTPPPATIGEAVGLADAAELVDAGGFVDAGPCPRRKEDATDPSSTRAGARVYGAGARVYGAGARVYGAGARVYGAERLRVAKGALAIFVGPEGDFAPEELSALVEIATPVSFGATILRAETAAIYGLSVLKAALDARLASPVSRP